MLTFNMLRKEEKYFFAQPCLRPSCVCRVEANGVNSTQVVNFFPDLVVGRLMFLLVLLGKGPCLGVSVCLRIFWQFTQKGGGQGGLMCGNLGIRFHDSEGSQRYPRPQTYAVLSRNRICRNLCAIS